MASPGSVTSWLRAIETGDHDAARHLWERYSPELHQVARRRMKRLRNKDIVDEEDIVLSAFASFCLAAREGKYQAVENRSELLGLLIVITMRKAGQRAQHVSAQKRGLGQVADQNMRRDAVGSGLQLMASDSPNPEEKLLLAEEAESLLEKLPSEDLRTVAIMRLAGHGNDEIAAALGYTRRTIQRMLSVIRGHWDEADADKASHAEGVTQSSPGS